VPYSERAHTFRTAVGDFPAARARSGSPSFVGLNVNSPVPSGFVAELSAQRRPARVEDGFGHLRFSELGRADIADDDQFVFASKLRAPLVKVVTARVGDLGVDRTDAAFVPGALRNSKRRLVSAVVTKCRNSRAIAARGKRLQAEIDADCAIAGGEAVSDFALEANVPSTTGVLHEAARFERAVDVARFPEVELALEVGDVRVVDLHGARNKRNPAEGALRAEASAPAKMATVGIALGGVLTADRLDGIRVQAEISATAGAEFYQVKGGRPFSNATGLPAGFGFALDLVAVVPDLIARDGVASEALAGSRVFDPVLVSQHRHGLFPPVQRGCKALDALGFEYLSAGAPLKPMHSRMWVGANRRFKLWVISKADAKIGALTDVEHFPGFGKEKVDRSHGRKHVTARQRQRREQEWLYAFWRHATQAGFKRSDVRAQNFALALPVLLRVRRQKLGFRFRDANSDGAFVCHPLYVLRIAVHCKWSPSYFAVAGHHSQSSGSMSSGKESLRANARTPLPLRHECRGFSGKIQ